MIRPALSKRGSVLILLAALGGLGIAGPVGLIDYVVVGFVGGFGFTTVVKKLIPTVL